MEKRIEGSAINVDGDFLWYIYTSEGKDMSGLREKLDLYLDGYLGHGISDIFYNVKCQCSIVPSSVMTWYGDVLERKVEGGIPVNYENHDRLLPYKLAYSDPTLDPVEYLVARTRREGIRAWLSFRMNDCHQSHEPTSWLRGDLYYEAKENGWMIGDDVVSPYFGECLDYSAPEIRDRTYDYIRETLDRYDADGIELDFMREIFCFNYKKRTDCAEIMTEFLTRVRRYVKKKEAERGHRILLSARIGYDIESSKIFGFDTARWVEEGLVDILIPSTRWQSTCSEMPVKEWMRLVEGSAVEVWPSLEFFLATPAANSPETVKALAAQYLEAGADKIYLFNYFRECAYAPDLPGASADPSRVKHYEDVYKREEMRNRGIWSAASSLEAARTGTRRYVLTYVEPSITPIGVAPIRPLPATVDGTLELTKQTGDISRDEVLLYLGVSVGDGAPEVTVDGNPAALIGTADDAYFSFCELFGGGREKLGDNAYYAYSVKTDGEYLRRISISGKCRLNYLEFKVTAK